ncbi:extensin family protein [Pseudorhodoferax sp. Leaf267]|uniref:extensin-like domain-containing protein n=1 Tax=Pseudorhodoferax sp. Leaf267 TaxID=1736316 RepID=UPI0006FB4A62|nr:extensin family protein [Pseudorhodoferax sp. Leaf267]KQP13815.1 extensin [Pseudorhodoferax sp. Leaf267]
MRYVLSLFALALAAAVATHGRLWTLPDRHNPWAPLAYDEAPGWLTPYKLSKVSAQPAACQAFLATTPWQTEPVPDRATGPGCGFTDAVRVRRTAVQVGEPFVLSCRAAASLALWERHVLQPQAEVLLGAPVRRIEHYGSYACRNVYGREAGNRSQHATADAFDVAGFVLQDGRRITLARDWGAGDDAKGRFLRAVHQGACGLFDGVLGPDYNQAHADHFHLDRGPYRMCR